jgi:adenylyltransferase/sulfurtransferase
MPPVLQGKDAAVFADRHHRQTLLPQVGQAGQAKLRQATALVVGCGALGTVAADSLCRAGVGRIVLVDRDVVEATNLQRQTLYVETDVGRPKVEAAAERLAATDSSTDITPLAIDLVGDNVRDLVEAADVVLDGTDNAETRYLLNDACVATATPWIYAAAVGTEARAMAVVPGASACLRCVFPDPPRNLATCDTAGVLAAAAGVAANLQAAAALRLLVQGDAAGTLAACDVWHGTMRTVRVDRHDACPCCVEHRFDFLDQPAGDAVSLCGRDTIQIRGTGRRDLARTAALLRPLGEVAASKLLVRFTPADATRARSLVARYVGA